LIRQLRVLATVVALGGAPLAMVGTAEPRKVGENFGKPVSVKDMGLPKEFKLFPTGTSARANENRGKSYDLVVDIQQSKVQPLSERPLSSSASEQVFCNQTAGRPRATLAGGFVRNIPNFHASDCIL
jgi:hypothetical protein